VLFRSITRAAVQAEVYTPQTAIDAGFLDEVVTIDELDTRALATATKRAELPQKFYARNKPAAPSEPLTAMQDFLNTMPTA